jgi:hypothetical protein
MSASPLAVSSIHEGIGTKILENLLPLFLVNHQIDSALVVSAFDAHLSDLELAQIGVPVPAAACLAALHERFLPPRTQRFEQFIFQRQEELGAASISLSAGSANQLAVDAE